MSQERKAEQHQGEETTKKIYSTPKLRTYGDLREITQGGGGSKGDGGSFSRL